MTSRSDPRHAPDEISSQIAECAVVQEFLQTKAMRTRSLRDAHRFASAALMVQAYIDGLRDVAQLGVTAWQAIETFPEDSDEVILRPHVVWGVMDVKRVNYKREMTNGMPWINGDLTTAWPEHVFYPVWMPMPSTSGLAKPRVSPAIALDASRVWLKDS